MSSIQELITNFYQSDEEHSEESAQAVIDAFLQKDTLMIARMPETKQFFISMESGQQTAIFFSGRDTFEKFAVYCQKGGFRVDAVEYTKDKQPLLFAELWRCGFTRIMIDFLPSFLNISLFDVFTPPDYSSKPLFYRPVIAPRMTGKILYLMQQIQTGKADGKLELDALTELYHSPFYTGAIPLNINGKRAMQISGHENADGTKTLFLFTDMKEYATVSHPAGELPSIAWYPDIQAVMNQGIQTAVINSGSTAPLTLDMQLLKVAEQSATGQTEDFTFTSMENAKLSRITDIENPPQDLLKALSAELSNHQQIKSAYLRMIQTGEKLRPSYFLILEAPTAMKAISRMLYQTAQTYLQGHDFECTALEKPEISQLVGKSKPFYKKKKVGFLK